MTPPDDREERRRLRPTVWLATLSTVVATATGMFALRDYIFASDSPAGRTHLAAAQNDAAATYQAAVARTCGRLYRNDKDTAENFRRFQDRLAKFDSGYDERNALVDVVGSSADRSRKALSTFQALEVYPSMLAPSARRVARAWRAKVRRLDAYTDDLRDAQSFGALVDAVSEYGDRRARDRADTAVMVKNLVKLNPQRCEPPDAITAPSVQLIGPPRTVSAGVTHDLPVQIAQASLAEEVDEEAPLPVSPLVPLALDRSPDIGTNHIDGDLNPDVDGDDGTPDTGDEGTPDTGDEGTPDNGDEGTPDTGDEGTPDTGDQGTPDTGDEAAPETDEAAPETDENGDPGTVP